MKRLPFRNANTVSTELTTLHKVNRIVQPTDVEQGLSIEQVQQRVALGKVNGDQNVKTKSVLQILRENIVTFFNFVFVVLAVLICCFVDANENVLTILGNFGF